MSLFLSQMLDTVSRALWDITSVAGVLAGLFLISLGIYVILKAVSR